MSAVRQHAPSQQGKKGEQCRPPAPGTGTQITSVDNISLGWSFYSCFASRWIFNPPLWKTVILSRAKWIAGVFPEPPVEGRCVAAWQTGLWRFFCWENHWLNVAVIVVLFCSEFALTSLFVFSAVLYHLQSIIRQNSRLCDAFWNLTLPATSCYRMTRAWCSWRALRWEEPASKKVLWSKNVQPRQILHLLSSFLFVFQSFFPDWCRRHHSWSYICWAGLKKVHVVQRHSHMAVVWLFWPYSYFLENVSSMPAILTVAKHIYYIKVI